MTTATIWQILGIDPTDDLRAIRRAYAAQLKAIDIDAEPGRFAALREAYEIARSEMCELPALFWIENVAPTAEPCEPGTAAMAGADRDSIERYAERIVHLLQGGEPIAAIEAELADVTLRMIAEVDRDTVDRQADAEEWIVATIAGYLPRSDAMVRPAVASYRWQYRQYGQYLPDKAMIVVDRMRELNFIQQNVLREGGRHHLAWRTLQYPPRRGFLQRPNFAALAALEAFFREAGDMPRIATLTFDMVIVAQWHAQLRRYDLALSRWKKGRGNDGPNSGWKYNVAVAIWALMILTFFGLMIGGLLASQFL